MAIFNSYVKLPEGNMEKKNSMKQPSWCIADLDEKGPALEGIETDDWTWSDLEQFQGQKLWPTEPDCNALNVWTTKIVICL